MHFFLQDGTIDITISSAPQTDSWWAWAAVAAVAVIMAYLTTADLWHVPSGSHKEHPLGLGSNFSKTVLTGLLGILAIDLFSELFPALESRMSADPRLVYVVTFAGFFLLFQGLWAFGSATAEAIRSAVVFTPSAKPRWYRSASIVVFLDTLLSVLKGRNEFESTIFEQKYRQIQLSIGNAIGEVRNQLIAAVKGAIQKKLPSLSLEPRDVRVNISMLSHDGESVDYILWSRGSVLKTFTRQSVAWIAVRLGHARWWRTSYSQQSAATERLEYAGRVVTASTPVAELPGGSSGVDLTVGKSVVRLPPNATLAELVAELQKAYRSEGQAVSVELMPSGRISVVAKDNVSLRLPSVIHPAGLRFYEYLPPSEILLAPDAADAEIGRPTISTHFQTRGLSDYEAFVVIPVPFEGRGEVGRAGAITISFKRAALMDVLWPTLDELGTDGRLGPDFAKHAQLLVPDDPELLTVLRGAKDVLARLFTEANPQVIREEHMKTADAQ